MTEIYASDLAKHKQNDGFMGEGFEDAMRKAEENDTELIIGEFCNNNQWREA